MAAGGQAIGHPAEEDQAEGPLGAVRFDNFSRSWYIRKGFASRLLLLSYHCPDGQSGRGPAPRLWRINAVLSMG